jgi:prephenate dehydratase
MSTQTKLANEVRLRDAGTAVHERINDPKPPNEPIYYRDLPRTSLLMELTDGVGVLHDVLRYFWKYDINVSRIESRPVKDGVMGEKRFDFFVDFDGQRGDTDVERLLDSLKPMTDKLLILDEKEVSVYRYYAHLI